VPHRPRVDPEGAAGNVPALGALAVHQEQRARKRTHQQALPGHQQAAAAGTFHRHLFAFLAGVPRSDP
jgi:hypothetical protein